MLYVDEVNLLDDHLVDLLLDAAAMGINTVEREGISVSHPARFILVGTMNPGGGRAPAAAARPLRAGGRDRRARRRRATAWRSSSGAWATMHDPIAFAHEWERGRAYTSAPASATPRRPAAQGRDHAPSIWASWRGWRSSWASTGIAPTWRSWKRRVRTRRWKAARRVNSADIRIAAELALPHRMRRQPFVDVQLDEERMGQIIQQESERTPGAGDEKKNRSS